jgi:hypothetical protein
MIGTIEGVVLIILLFVVLICDHIKNKSDKNIYKKN